MTRSVRWEPGLVSGPWGWAPALSVLCSVSILLLSLANTLARAGWPLAEALFWIALPIAILPISVALLRAQCPRRERVALVVLIGLTLYGPAVMTSPGSFDAYDELLHLRTVEDILRAGHLFQPNPLLIVSPYFPALETTTSAIMQLSGADAFPTGLVLLAFTRIVFAISLFLLFEEASSSARVAGIAALVYMLNPSFVDFDGQFGYQSLALPLVPLILFLTARWARSEDGPPPASIGLLIGLLLATVIISHHITSYALVALLAGWSVLHIAMRRSDIYQGSIVRVAVLAALGAVAWLLVVATLTIGYLVPPLAGAVLEAIRLVTTGEGRELFVSATGELAPLWQRLIGFAATGILLAGLPLGIAAVLGRPRRNSLAMLLVGVALAYPVSLVLRLTPTGSEAAGRSLAIIFLGVAFVAAEGTLLFGRIVAWLTSPPRPQPIARGVGRVASMTTLWGAVFALGVGVLAVGGVILGISPANRLAGPYLVGADSRSIDAESTAAAVWAGEVLGHDRRIAADRVNRLLMGSYGIQHVVFHHSEGIQTWQLFLSPVVGPAEGTRLRRLKLEFLLIDRRLSHSLPLVPFYYEEGEIFEGVHSRPIPAAILGKWDQSRTVDRIYDSGAIQIYDVRRLSGVE